MMMTLTTTVPAPFVQTFDWMTEDETFAEHHDAVDPMSHVWDLIAETRSDRRTGKPLRSAYVNRGGLWTCIESIDRMPNR
jgi:hypothetical protein